MSEWPMWDEFTDKKSDPTSPAAVVVWLGVIFVICGILGTAVVASRAPVKPVKESEAQAEERLAEKYDAKRQEVLWDGTRPDLISESFAFEIDFAPSWAEAIGQSLYYAEVTGKRPAIILLVRHKDERRFVYRCAVVCAKYEITLFVEESP